MAETVTQRDEAIPGVRFSPGGGWNLVLCNGMIRSASTWSYNAALRLLRAAVGSRCYGDYSENTQTFLDAAPATADYLALKCHMLDGAARALIDTRRAKVIYTCRELADAAASFMRMFAYDFDHTCLALQGALELYRLHRDSGTALILGYSGITSQPLRDIARIAEYLEIAAPEEVLGAIAEATSLERARARVEALKAGADADQLVRFDRFVHDRETLLNLDHIRDGSTGYGRDLLTADQLARIDALAAQYDFRPEGASLH
ncbi:MAG: sulfotransferase domain-containing protein [Acidobacteriaceae bacterium]